MSIYVKKYPLGYYVYAYLRNRDSLTIPNALKGTPYYIGKGQCYRAWEKHTNTRTPKNSDNIVIIAGNLTESSAHSIETVQIMIWGRIDINTGILRNKTNGGEGVSGYRHSIETRLQMSETRKGRPAYNKGQPMSADAIERMKLSRTGRRISDETKQKLSIALKGRARPLEVRQKNFKK